MTVRQIMIVAGEASGDLHAAKLVRAVRTADAAREYRFFGSAGPEMRKAGVESIVAADEMAVVGLAEIAGALPMFFRARKSLLLAAKERRPAAAVLVDFPDFNLKLARSLKKMGIPVAYYISPQVWAWRKYRLRSIKKYVDILLTILPFEEKFFRRNGVNNVIYVGSPLAREVFPTRTKKEFCQSVGLDSSKPLIALLPGSRRKEIDRILPVMAAAMTLLRELIPVIQFAIAAASDQGKKSIASMIAGEHIPVVVGETYNLLYSADAAAVTSGTATMEAGIIGTPQVVVYKTSALNYALLEPLISVEHYGLINLIAGERVAEELIQAEFTPDTLAAEIIQLLDPSANLRHREKLKLVVEKLGQGGASKRAAEAIIDLMDDRRPWQNG